jgi:hypothetical protein
MNDYYEDGNDEEYEEDYGKCDSCGDFGTVIDCPSLAEEIDHKGIIYGKLCEDCCESAFESDPVYCMQNIDDCPRVRELQLALLKKIAKERNFNLSQKFTGVYVNSENTVGIGGNNVNPNETFKDETISVDKFYKGNEYSFAIAQKRKYAYSNELIDEALDFLRKIGEEDLDYSILFKSGALIIRGYSAWSIVMGLDVDWPYISETRDFLEKVRDGYEIFKEDVKDEIKLVDLTREIKLDWNKLEPSQFEELCREILGSFESISECVLTGATGDEGRDIKAKERVDTITGVELRNWCIQCKHFPSRSVRRQDIEDLRTLQTRFRFDVYCIMTSGTFSPGALRLLEEYEKQGFRIKYMDRRFLEDRIMRIPGLLEKFYKLCSK